jgi:hypothetical protein
MGTDPNGTSLSLFPLVILIVLVHAYLLRISTRSRRPFSSTLRCLLFKRPLTASRSPYDE